MCSTATTIEHAAPPKRGLVRSFASLRTAMKSLTSLRSIFAAGILLITSLLVYELVDEFASFTHEIWLDVFLDAASGIRFLTTLARLRLSTARW